MKKLADAFRAYGFTSVSLPLAVVLLLALTFGWFINKLGFYWDDWAFILTGKMQGLNQFWHYHSFDRPVSAWINVVQFPFVGTSPLAWQIFSLGLRAVTAVLIGWTVRLIWPRRVSESAWVALLFAVYPVFSQQPIAVTYTQHWTCYILYMLSLAWMVLAIRKPNQVLLFSALALAASALNLFSMEYFAGVELLRPLILWYLMRENRSDTLRRSLRQTFLRWLPYLIVVVAFVLWRVFFIHLPAADPNQLRLLEWMRQDPINGLRTLIKFVLEDSVYVFFTGWRITNFLNLPAAVISLATAALTVIYLANWKSELDGADPERRVWALQAILFGVLSAVTGPSPAWLTGKQVAVGEYSSRFALPALFGLSLLVVALLSLIFSRRSTRLVIYGIVVALAVMFQQDNAVRFVQSWSQQKSFYWQVYWRMPSIQSHTPVLSDGEVLNLVGFYSTTAGLNLLYDRGSNPSDLDYWFFNLENKYNASSNALDSKRPFSPSFRNWSFTGNIKDSLVINNGTDICVRVIGNGYPENVLYTPLLQKLAPASNFSRIQADGKAVTPPRDIFGREPTHTWCYFYQAAELARQRADWNRVVSLGQEAQTRGYEPNDPVEWFPFIEGYALAGRTSQAEALTRKVLSASPSSLQPLCALWSEVSNLAVGNPSLVAQADKVRGQLSCPAH